MISSVIIHSVCILFLCVIVVMCATNINKKGQNACKEVPDETLETILGPAFNARYMSLEMPSTEEPDTDKMKRKVDYDVDFAVDSGFEGDFDRRAAWTVSNHVDDTRKQYDGDIRYKRQTDFVQEWHCKSRIHWIDLGPNYFPRYLRSVECLTENCWFNLYKCRPKAFTVKLLKRLPEKCVRMNIADTGFQGLPKELRELWIWEERAVNFCCDCAT